MIKKVTKKVKKSPKPTSLKVSVNSADGKSVEAAIYALTDKLNEVLDYIK